jgi:hypothetical protein
LSNYLRRFGRLRGSRQFAIVVHDLDHPGVSNALVVEEEHPLVIAYNGKSVSEHNSIDVSWKLLMEPQFANLRNWILTTEADTAVFRQIVVNAVMATDLFNKDLQDMRETRRMKTFSGQHADCKDSSNADSRHQKAVIVINLIIQASDVSHTMQHSTVCKKWNMKLLTEMYAAYRNGRKPKDLIDGWY